MSRLEFTANGHNVVVEDVDPNQVATLVASLVATFDGIAEEAREKARAAHAAREEAAAWDREEEARTARRKRPLDFYFIESRSSPGAKRVVAHYGNGIFECNCEGFTHRGYCRHTIEALNQHRVRHGLKR